jgi:hypothetical protein
MTGGQRVDWERIEKGGQLIGRAGWTGVVKKTGGLHEETERDEWQGRVRQGRGAGAAPGMHIGFGAAGHSGLL